MNDNSGDIIVSIAAQNEQKIVKFIDNMMPNEDVNEVYVIFAMVYYEELSH
jgi:hypothetical protein